MTDKAVPFPEDFASPVAATGETPRHGYRGDSQDSPPAFPWGLTVAISRETGARGATIAKRAAEKMGWQIYSQELLEYIAQEGNFRDGVLDRLPASAGMWVEDQLNRLLKQQSLSANASIMDLARVILSLGAQGEIVLLGRGAGCILPPHSTFHVRLVAPVADRIAYMSQWMRLTEEEAAQQVQTRDRLRSEFIATHFHRDVGAVHQFDMILNSSLLGEERCADLILHGARAKAAAMKAGTDRATDEQV